MLRHLFATFLLLAAPMAALAAEDGVVTVHGVSLFDNLKYGPDFTHFDYVNPDAPKGGEARFAAAAQDFDSLNPFVVKGTPAQGLGLIYDTLLSDAMDEPSTMYGLVAESVEYPEDKSWVIFNLRPEARFSDGEPLDADDVLFSFKTLTGNHPFYKQYYHNVVDVEALSPHRVKFTFDEAGNRELPMIVGQLAVLPQHYWQDREFNAATLEPPLGSGPYTIGEVVPGRSITYQRNPDYWAADLPVNKGQHNFDRLRIEYYRDGTVAQEAFKAGEYDYVLENSSKDWATAYDFPAVKDGRVQLEELPDGNVQYMQGFVFNTRKAKFSDPTVRQALAYAMDFEWLNANIFYGQYTRTESYWDGSELGSSGLPEGEELAILEPYRDQLPPEVFTTEYHPPSTEPPGGLRDNLRTAQKLLREAGWSVQGGKLTNNETGEVMSIEFLMYDASFERVVAPLIRNLERLGVEGSIRLIDTAQYVRRTDAFDFDMITASFPQSHSPGNEQRDFWGSQAAETEGSRNLAGIQDPVVDALIEKIVFAPDRESLVAATNALDRVLLWGHYVIPQWHIAYHRVAYWDKFDHSEVVPKYSVGFPTVWWYDAEKAARIDSGRAAE